jgi:AcrR family transcriptional regulator
MTTTTTARPASRRQDTSFLTRDDWINAAFNAVVDNGFGAVRVLTIAQTIGVTRGSFYWHFGSQSDLIEVLIERWCAGETERMRVLTEAATGDPVTDLIVLIDDGLALTPAKVRDMRFELALRALGRSNMAAAARIAEIDRVRVDATKPHYLAMGHDDERAHRLTAVFYMAIGGACQGLGTRPDKPDLPQYMRDSIIDLLVRPYAPT